MRWGYNLVLSFPSRIKNWLWQFQRLHKKRFTKNSFYSLFVPNTFSTTLDLKINWNYNLTVVVVHWCRYYNCCTTLFKKQSLKLPFAQVQILPQHAGSLRLCGPVMIFVLAGRKALLTRNHFIKQFIIIIIMRIQLITCYLKNVNFLKIVKSQLLKTIRKWITQIKTPTLASNIKQNSVRSIIGP